MPSLKVTAHLRSGFATCDDWSPDLAGLLAWLILDSKGLASPHPTIEDARRNAPVIAAEIPLAAGELAGEPYWQTSAPCYEYTAEHTDKFRKRWSPGIDSPPPAWGKRKPKWSASEGQEKNYDLPNYIRVTPCITWYAVGDVNRLTEIIQGCTGLGKKRSHGHGQVSAWEVDETEEDWHTYNSQGDLMRPIPLTAIDRKVEYAVREWGWLFPAWLPENKRICAMPVKTARRVKQVWTKQSG
ncbi:MAG: hypothetical protein HC910_22430 [Spirulinaceae cyanobacterium SM2_1_0]|nr:hypothetical protein [Spirulinaceae cyanobacterium SM2_1_0]